MSTTLGEAAASAWEARRRRAAELLSRLPHAEEILGFYLRLLDLQESLHLGALAAEGAPDAEALEEEETLASCLQQLLLPRSLHSFRTFVMDVAGFGTAVIADIGGSLQAAGDESLRQLLGTFLAEEPLDSIASVLQCDPHPLVFFPRAFIQPIAEAAAERNTGSQDHGQHTLCPSCQRPPQVACIRDEAEVLGRNLLVCSLCSTGWTFPRSTCPNCLASGPEAIVFHLAESLAHIRIAECRSCQGYLKSVDLRECPTAVPLVEDLATAELDLWSAERGLRKIQPNLLGF